MTATAADQKARLNARYANPGGWPDPAPLVPDRAHVAFPVDALPGPFGEFAAAVAEATQTPGAMAASCVLGVLSTCAGGRVTIRARPGWVEPANLYLVPVMSPGSRKSAVIAAATRPLFEVERQLRDEHGPRVAEARALRDMADQQADVAMRKAAKATADQRDAAAAEAVSLKLAADGIEVPSVPRLVADDVTPEAVAGLLADQGGRIAILSAEGGIFDTLAGRYSNGVANLDAFLKGHAGDPLRIDRRGRPPELVDAPSVTLLLTVQPAVLDAIARNPSFSGRGLLARILFSIPEQTVGSRRVGAAPVPEALGKDYAEVVAGLALGLDGWRDDPAVITLDPTAHDALLALERHLEPRLAPHGDLGGIVDWAAKLAGATVRIAGLLHLAAHGPEGHRTPITGGTFAAAERIGRYFLEHARTAFAVLGADPQTAAAVQVLDHLRRHGIKQFTIRELHMKLSRSRFATAEDVRRAVDVLADHGWARQRPQPTRSGPGRPPSPTFEVHPRCTPTESTQYTERDPHLHSVDSVDSVGPPRGAA